MDKKKELIRILSSIFFGADLFILSQCEEDKIKFIKYELGIIFVTIMTFLYTKYITQYWFVCGIAVLLIYKLFLSNLNIVSRGENSYVVIKFLFPIIFSVLSAGIIIDLLDSLGIIGLHYINVYEGITIGVVVIVVFFVVFYPVRFEVDKNSLYAKLYNQYIEANQSQAEIKVKKQINELEQNARIQEKINVTVEKEYVKRLSNEIVEARMRIAKLAIEKWEKEQLQKIEINVEDYINNLK